MISMQAIDSEYVGDGADWPISLNALFENNLISDEHLFDACVLWEFGYLINNTDMHLGNISLAMDGNIFRVLPAYDMCSMGFRPHGDEVPAYHFKPAPLHSRLNTLSDNQNAMARVVDMAVDFWQRVAADTRISNELREFLAKGNPLEAN